ncbi:MAG: response regulator [Treponema sp.]|nr:response regulator [Treponema sp.]MCL2237454.1 response regulator [Treponema sp.]
MSDDSKNSVLIVDDERANLDFLVSILSPDYTVYMTKSGASAIEMANELMPDIVLLDIIMQDMSGYEVLKVLKSEEKTKEIPVIFITGLEGKEDEEKGLALQAADYIHKPMSPAIVKMRVSNQLQIVNQIRAIKNYAYEVALSEERNKFFARMSHEMRTPLNAVIGLSEMTLEQCSLCDEAEENILKVCNAGASLLHMVNDILDMSKLDEGKFNLVPIEYIFPQMISDTVSQSIVYKGEKPIDFILNIDENIPLRLYGDDQRIKQIMNNLLSNAFKYTKEGKIELNVSCKKTDETVMLSFTVRDTGIGMPKEFLGSLFLDYARMDTEDNRKIAGTGLGLPIVKMLVDMMDGDISVESELGKGSCFKVNFPQKLVSDEVIGFDIVNNLQCFQYASRRKIKSRISRISLPYASVLVVDDVITNLDVARGMMKPYRMKVDCVTSGQAAVDAIRNESVKYNAIFMDQMMPEMDGMEAVRIIREEIGTEYAKTVPIIAFTANALVGNKEMFLSKGFNAYITKPLDVNQLDEIIRKFVKDEDYEKILEEGKNSEDGKPHLSLPEFNTRSGDDRRTGDERRSGIERRLFEDRIEGINLRKGLERFSGDRETFLQVLRSFATNTHFLLEQMKDVNRDNLQNYAINVHGIKSSCRGICAVEAGMQAENLEKAAKAGNLDFVLINNPNLIENVLTLMANINRALSMEIVNVERIKKDKPYKEALEKLQAACEDYKAEEIDTIMREIECFEYTNDDGFVRWLKTQIEQMNFMEAAERLSGELNA